jgi:hypothetical protein
MRRARFGVVAGRARRRRDGLVRRAVAARAARVARTRGRLCERLCVAAPAELRADAFEPERMRRVALRACGAAGVRGMIVLAVE